MQVGKIHGLALAILGVVLLGLQAWFYVAPKASSLRGGKQTNPKRNTPSSRSEHRFSLGRPLVLCLT
jgi:hypothetical protein